MRRLNSTFAVAAAFLLGCGGDAGPTEAVSTMPTNDAYNSHMPKGDGGGRPQGKRQAPGKMTDASLPAAKRGLVDGATSKSIADKDKTSTDKKPDAPPTRSTARAEDHRVEIRK